MAHRLSSSLYDDGNKMSKGQVFFNFFSKLKNKVFLKKNIFVGSQEMYLKRAKNAGNWVHRGSGMAMMGGGGGGGLNTGLDK